MSMRHEREYTLLDLEREAKREVAMRKRVYPGQVQRGGMPQSRANAHIAMMEQIGQYLTKLRLTEMGIKTPNTDYGPGPVERYMLTLTTHEVSIMLIYVDGILHTLTALEERAAQVNVMKLTIPTRSADLPGFMDQVGPAVKLTRLDTLATGQVIAAFCAAYKRQFNKAYTPTPREKKMLKEAELRNSLDLSLLDSYMRTTKYPFNGPKTIQDWCNHHAALPQMATDPDGLPRHYDHKLYQRLAKENPQAYQAYRVKLTNLGFRETNTPEGKIWTK